MVDRDRYIGNTRSRDEREAENIACKKKEKKRPNVHHVRLEKFLSYLLAFPQIQTYIMYVWQKFSPPLDIALILSLSILSYRDVESLRKNKKVQTYIMYVSRKFSPLPFILPNQDTKSSKGKKKKKRSKCISCTFRKKKFLPFSRLT